MPRFVLLRHETPPGHPRPSHWDLMLEHGGVLLTWELQTLPGPWAEALGEGGSGAGDAVEAHRLADHRLAYLEIEGPISGGRGTVRRCDRGLIEMELGKGSIIATLDGDRLWGQIELREEADSRWLLAVSPRRRGEHGGGGSRSDQ